MKTVSFDAPLRKPIRIYFDKAIWEYTNNTFFGLDLYRMKGSERYLLKNGSRVIVAEYVMQPKEKKNGA
jgi:hypothetical protein